MRTTIHQIVRRLAALPTVFILCIGVGCRSAPSDNSLLTSEFGEVFGEGAADAAKQGSSTGWTIVLAAFSGPDAGERADAAAARVRENTWMGDLRVRQREDGAVLSFGEYPTPDNRQAQRDLQRVRRTTLDEQNAFQAAFLAPPPDRRVEGSHPELALSNVRETYGPTALYTLQVGVYESPDRREAMRSAEQAALQLRREGELAFYHHGPSRSMVTVGVFSAQDYDLSSGRMSQEILDLKSRHPYNLYNGMGVKERGSLGERIQPSGLVRIPE